MATTFSFDGIPAMLPPPGRQTNFEDPENLHSFVFGVAVTTIILMTTALGIRIYTKAVLLKEMRAEEYFAIIGTIGIITWDAMFINVSADGFSRHLWDVRLVDVPHLSYMSYLAEITNAPTMFAAKCSILFQFRRLFCPGQIRDSTFWMIHALLFMCAAYYTSAIFTFTFQCTPREKTWSPFLEGHCIDVAAAIVVQGAINLFLDIGILITPLWAIWRLQLPMKRKLGISAVFGVGILTCGIAIAGVVFRVPLLTDPDLTWLITKVGIWTMIEYCGTILVGCMPSFPRFFLHIQGKDVQTHTHGSTAPSSNNATRPGTATKGQHHSHSRSKNGSGGISIHSHAHAHSHSHSHSNSPTNRDSINGVGVALSTSEVSFQDPAYIEMESGTLSFTYPERVYLGNSEFGTERKQERRSESTTDDSAGCGSGSDGDWSPLSTTPTRG
ncbi:hypothetical protein B0T16DRAFT_337567 [Cercophora newfieldiana]|uniref:Rhodopsin domain-containing protein n=1 Tax=Cercophora newfieldiana TaxID=92897 RepID=A0AA39XR21_9PEZI|nr:hypothetical protein B0T16DRAFT_337567 [Cercophora newfieldiana]